MFWSPASQRAMVNFCDLAQFFHGVAGCGELGKDRVFNVEESTIRLLKNVLDEVLELFPSKFIHIGGDEVSRMPCVPGARVALPCGAAGLQQPLLCMCKFLKELRDLRAGMWQTRHTPVRARTRTRGPAGQGP
jgi:N-acetyl-beta-hexosaminidase